MLLPRRRRTAFWLLAMLAAFAATHRPPPSEATPALINDKMLHYLGFVALGTATAWRAAETARPISGRTFTLMLAGLAAYGLVDEATQPFVGRSFDWLDWTADACGAAFGISLMASWRGVSTSVGPATNVHA